MSQPVGPPARPFRVRPTSVRVARPRDLRFLAPLEEAADVRFSTLLGRTGWGRAPRGGDRDQVPGVLLVTGDPPVGFVHVVLLDDTTGRHAHLEQLSVHPDRARRGLGTALVGAAEQEVRRDGFSGLSLCTFRDVAWNGPFYRRLGYRPIEPSHSLPPYLAQLRERERQRGLDRLGTREVLLKQLC